MSSIQSSHDPFHDMTEVVRKYLVVPEGDSQKGVLYNEELFRTQVAAHLAQFVLNFSHQVDLKPGLSHAKNLLALRKWSQFTHLCQSIGDSPFSYLPDSEVNHLLLGDGLCVGAVLQHFSQLFKSNSSLSLANSFPMKVGDPLIAKEVTFYPFKVDEKLLEKQTREFRFLQAAYRVAYGMRREQSLEFVPQQVLKSNNLELVRRIPDFTETKLAFPIQEFLPELKQLADEKGSGRGYLLGINDGSTRHSIALCLQPPYHFMDLRHGVVVAHNLESLLLFLANYLTLKYPKSYAFALLEFRPLSTPESLETFFNKGEE
jgi:hypothetical protein